MKTHKAVRSQKLVFDFSHPEGWHAFVTATRGKIYLYVYDSVGSFEEEGREYDPTYLMHTASIAKCMFPHRSDRSIGSLLINSWRSILHEMEFDMMEIDMMEDERLRTNR